MIKTLSIPQWQEDFLKENPELSPSKLLQAKIKEVHANRKVFYPALRKKDQKIEALASRLQTTLDELAELRENVA